MTGHRFTPGLRLALCRGWAKGLVKALLGRARGRFVQVSPPINGRHLLYCRESRAFFRFVTRDYIDWRALRGVLVDEAYDIGSLTRGKELMSFYAALIASGKKPLIVDCGANIGASAKYFSMVFPGASVVAVEPEQNNMALARINANATNVAFLQGAIASQPARGRLLDPGLGNDAFRVAEDSSGSLSLFSIDSILDDPAYANHVPFIVKMDVEGFEEEIFSKNTAWIRRIPLLIVELHDWMLPGRASSRNFLQCIAQENRDFILSGENVFSIANDLQARAG